MWPSAREGEDLDRGEDGVITAREKSENKVAPVMELASRSQGVLHGPVVKDNG